MAGERISDKHLKERIDKAYDLRYNQGYTQDRYVKWAKDNYGDKSEQQYCQYFLKAREVYEASWKDLLEKQLQPATEELIRLLADENPKVRDGAIAKIFKYTGNDITKVQADIKGEINISFGSDE